MTGDGVSEDRLAALEARVGVLEDQLGVLRDDDRSRAPSDRSILDAERSWALAGLKQRLPHGGVLVTGSIGLPHDDQVAAEWQQASGREALLDADWSELAAPLAALGHPVRLELLRAVLTGTTTTTGLSELEAMGTRGQLHHHLRELTAAGWLRSAGRGFYEVPATRVVPLLATILGAQR